MKTMDYLQQPQAIEDKSFVIIGDIIRETRPDYRFASPLHEAIIKRVIHTTADFDWLDILWFSRMPLKASAARFAAAVRFIPTPPWPFPG
jgi:precorrin-8X/cobalt-precorrin-8 methylmutase